MCGRVGCRLSDLREGGGGYTPGAMRRIDLRRDSGREIPRPEAGEESTAEVRRIIDEVRSRGDAALIELTEKFDGVKLSPDRMRVSEDEMKAAVASAPKDLIAALEEAVSRLTEFCRRQLLQPWEDNIGGGVLGESVHPVGRAGIYAPGGRAVYPSVVVMCGVPASVAGVERRIICVPPSKDGGVAAATLAAASVVGIDEVYRVGGAQAIAAMAFGTGTIPKVDVITGGGGIWVALAKREVSGFVAIDSVAGPSEIAIVADGGAAPMVLACDLIAQAEHGPGGSFLLVTWVESLAEEVEQALDRRLADIDAGEELRSTIELGAVSVLVADLDQAVAAVEEFAPEHVELICEGAGEVAGRIRNCGAIFVGPFTPVSLGDYLAGSNHTLPTMGAARWASGLRASLFQRASAVVTHDRQSLAGALGHIRALAEAEGLPNHARAVEARLAGPNRAENGLNRGDERSRAS